jgi:hypothetical protein
VDLRKPSQDRFRFESYSPSTTAPDVTLTDQASAAARIQAAGLTVGTISQIVAITPLGLVLAQDSPAGTIESLRSRGQVGLLPRRSSERPGLVRRMGHRQGPGWGRLGRGHADGSVPPEVPPGR